MGNQSDGMRFETSPCSPTIARQNSLNKRFDSGTHLAHEMAPENESARRSRKTVIDQQISGVSEVVK